MERTTREKARARTTMTRMVTATLTRAFNSLRARSQSSLLESHLHHISA
jgi:hypothetical protein